tara:strand:- start:567 stop:1196 length:630 start_codon:yes stop_codon:yes gene_type:complete
MNSEAVLKEISQNGNHIVSDEALDTLFREARTYSHWKDKEVSDVVLNALYDLLKFGPTSANMCPARFYFVKSDEAKAKLKPTLAEGNVEKTMSAPVTVIIGQDMEFYEKLPKLFPQTDAKSWFEGNDEMIKDAALRNTALQGAYLIMAARSVGLDCGPMSGFDSKALDEAFFEGTSIKSNFLCNLGYGDASKLHPRNPRLPFEEACKIL